MVPTKDDDGKGRKMTGGVTAGEKEGDEQLEEDTADKGTKTGKKEDPKKKPRSTPSVARLKEENARQKLKNKKEGGKRRQRKA